MEKSLELALKHYLTPKLEPTPNDYRALKSPLSFRSTHKSVQKYRGFV
jgi:hypothetical protein